MCAACFATVVSRASTRAAASFLTASLARAAALAAAPLPELPPLLLLFFGGGGCAIWLVVEVSRFSLLEETSPSAVAFWALVAVGASSVSWLAGRCSRCLSFRAAPARSAACACASRLALVASSSALRCAT